MKVKRLDEFMKKETASTAKQQPTPQYKIIEFYRETEFQETEIGKIPSEWRIVKIRDIAVEIKSGFASGRRDDTNGIIHLRMFNIDLDGLLSFKEIVKVPKPEGWREYLLRHGDILLVNTSGSEEHIGKVAIFENVKLECTYSNHLTRIRIDQNKIDPRWVYFVLYHLWQSGYFKSLIHHQAGGQRNIPLKAVENLPIILPQANEARKVAEILSTINKAIEGVDESVARLERLKRALMRELLTGRVRVREENGKLVFHRETEFQETEIEKIPRDWKVVKLKDVATKVKMGGTPKRTVKEYWDGDIPFAKIEDITNSKKYIFSTSSTITKLGLENSNAWLVPIDSLLITIYGTLGAVAINKVEVATNQAIVGVVPRRELIDVEFLYYWYLYYQPNWIRFIKKSTQPNLTLEIVANSKVPLPSLAEQKTIAEILSTIDKAIELYHEKRVRLERLKKGLMDLLLTGRVRVRVKPAS